MNANHHSILIVDDNDFNLIAMKNIIQKWDYQVDTFTHPHEAIQAYKQKHYQLVITDLKMNQMNGIEVTKRIREINPDQSIIIITAFGDIETAVIAIRNGATDYIERPVNMEYLRLKIEQIIDKNKILNQIKILQKQQQQIFPQSELIIGNSKSIKEIHQKIGKVAESDATILITGESGTGKELVARMIHSTSKRKDKPFVAINCSALPCNLLENELFGHIKGAYTGAYSNEEGLFQKADGGTIFLDEIGDIAPSTQLSLLRVLQENEIKPLGSNKIIKVNVRVISATNKDLSAAIKDQSFREDLFYRLNVIPFHIAPLRERVEDIKTLAYHFLDKFNRKYNKSIQQIDREALRALFSYKWPGNVRELENLIENAVILAESDLITLDDITLPHSSEQSFEEYYADEHPKTYNDAKADFEKKYLQHILTLTHGNVKMAAGIAQKDRKAFYNIMKKHNIDADAFRPMLDNIVVKNTHT